MSKAIRQEAEAVGDVVDAAKLRERWNRELQSDDGISNARADSLAEGVDLLEDRYPEIMGLAVGEANDFARRRPDAEPLSEAADVLGEEAGSRSPGKRPRSPRGTGRESRPSGGRRERAQPRSRARSSRGPVGRYGRHAYRETGIPGATTSATNMALSIFGMTVGLSLLYLLLTNAESAGPGRSAVAQLSRGFSGAIRALILPVDPLHSVGAAKPTAADEAAGAGARDGQGKSVTPTLRNNVQGPIQRRHRSPQHVFDSPHLGPQKGER